MNTNVRLPADYTRCVNSDCAMRIRCLRWLCREDSVRSTVTSFAAWPACGAWLPDRWTSDLTEPNQPMNTNEPTTPSAIRSGEPLWCADCKSYHPIGLHTDTPSAAPTPETPETEAVMTDPLRDGNDLPALARRLERERDEARAELARLKANNRYQRGYHDGEQAAREELKTPTPPTEGSAVEWAQTKMITREDIDGDLFKCLQEDDAIELARRADEAEHRAISMTQKADAFEKAAHRLNEIIKHERESHTFNYETLRAQLAAAQAEAGRLREALEEIGALEGMTLIGPGPQDGEVEDEQHAHSIGAAKAFNQAAKTARAALAKKEGQR